MTTWLSDPSANRHIKTYINEFLDISGSFSVRQTSPLGSGTYESLGQVITNFYESDGLTSTGYAVDMDASGNTIVIGSPDEITGSYNGHARVYRYDASAKIWYQLGNDLVTPDGGINGTAYDQVFGNRVHISDDGNVVLVFDTHWDNQDQGQFYVFRYNSSTNNWNFEYLNRPHAHQSYFGFTGSSLSGDGNVIAANEHLTYYGCKIYKKVSGSWIQIGTIGDTSTNGPQKGTLNYDGSRIVFLHQQPTRTVRVYAYNGADVASTSSAAFSQVGSDISNPNGLSNHLEQTAINKAGDIIAFSNGGDDVVYVYKYNNATSNWVQHGSSIGGLGDNPGYGESEALQLNDDGDMIIIGVYNAYKAYVFKYDNSVSDWVQFGNTLTNSPTNGRFGFATAFNNDATRVIVGAYQASLTSTNGGGAYVYQLADPVAPTSDKTIDVSNGVIDLYPSSDTFTTTYSLDRIQYLGQNDYMSYQFGISVDINADGSVIVVGAPNSGYGNYNTTNNTSLSYVGRVFVYQKTSSGYYLPLGNQIEGDRTSAHVGRRVAIDNSGNRIAIGLLNSSTGTNRGRLQMYELSGNVWTQLGSDINGDADNDRFGEMAMHISGNGKVVVGHAGSNGKNYIRAYEYVDATGTWTQLGSDITDFPTGGADWTQRIALSDDGRILAFGNTYDDTTGTDNGKLQVYKFTGDVNSGSWSALGSYITVKDSNGSQNDEWGKRSVSLSSDGYTVAWSSPYTEVGANTNGRAQVYRYSALMGDWMQLGSDIIITDAIPTAEAYFAKHCHLSGDGNTLVVTSHTDDDGATNAGGFYAFKYINGDWTSVAGYFENLATELYVGEHSVRISKDGTHIISGSYRHDNNATDTGMAVVCKLNSSTSNDTSSAPLILDSNEIKTQSLHFKYDGNSALYHPDGQALINNTGPGSLIFTSKSNQGGLTVMSGGTLYVGYANAVSQAAATQRVYWQTFESYNGSMQWSLYAHGAILSDEAIIAARGGLSDRRIKTNIQTINDASSLEKLRLLNPRTYEYIDKIRKTSYPVEGFIAQEVKEIMPYAVDDDLEYAVPNIFKLGYFEMDASGNKIINIPDYDTANLEVDASGNIYDQLTIYDNNLSYAKEYKADPDIGDRYDVNIIKVLSSTSIQIEPIHSDTLPEEILVYGQIVKNFHTLNKNRIFTVMTSALQEVDRQLQAERTKTASLKTELASLIADVTALENT